MAPDEMQVLAHVKRVLRGLGLNSGGNPKSDVHRLEWLSYGLADTNLRTARLGIANGRTGRGRRCASWPADVQETPLVFFQHKAGQAPGGIPGRVYSDPIEANLRVKRRRVAVHDKLSVL